MNSIQILVRPTSTVTKFSPSASGRKIGRGKGALGAFPFFPSDVGERDGRCDDNIG